MLYSNKAIDIVGSMSKATYTLQKKVKELSVDDRLKALGADKKLTRKQLEFVRYLLSNPKASATQAVIHAYDPMKYDTAKAMASENLAKPYILNVLRDASEEAESTITSVMRLSEKFAHGGGKDGAAYASVAKGAAEAVLDRVHGKPTQRIEQSTSVVAINIDLTAAVTP